MRRYLFLAVTVGAMTCLLLSSRCSEDQDRKSEAATAAEEPLPVDTPATAAGKASAEKVSPDGGLSDADTPLEDANDLPPQSGDSMDDDQTFEPQPVPEDTKGL